MSDPTEKQRLDQVTRLYTIIDGLQHWINHLEAPEIYERPSRSLATLTLRLRNAAAQPVMRKAK